MSYLGFHKCVRVLEEDQTLHVKENTAIIFYCFSSYSLSSAGERGTINLYLVLEEWTDTVTWEQRQLIVTMDNHEVAGSNSDQ